jgi:subtilisin-like proprotein convertase family protein
MGMADMGGIIQSGTRLVRDQRPEDVFTASLQQRVFTGRVADATKPLRITMAYTDAPGPTTGNSFVNQLSLRVIVNGVAYWGNSFSSNVSVTGGAEDLRNNLQSVFFPAGTFAVGDRVSIQVRGRTIAGDGVPNSGGAVDQDFALVAFNVAEENLVYPLVSTTVSDTLGTGNSNTNMEPGESGVRLAPTVENAGTSPLPISYIRLISTTPGVRVVQGLCVAPAMNPGQSFPLTATPFEIAVDSSIPCQTTVTLRSDFIDLGGNVVGQAPLTYVTGGAAPLNTTTRNNLALAISTGAPSSFEVPIAVSGSGIASRVDVRVRLTHTWISDIRLTLIGPDNTSVILANQVGGSGDNMTNTVFSDTASEGISSGTPPFTGTFRPTAPLSAFVGKSINGNWRLVVADVAQDDGGTFEDVELRFFTDGCTAASSSGVFYRSSVTDWSATGPFGVDLGGDNAFLSSRGLGSRTRNTAVGAIGLSVNAVANGGPNRIFGFLESETGALPYSSVGTNNFVRARYAVTYSGPGNSGSATTYNLVPNFRIRAGMRFVDTAIMEVLHNSGNTDPASKDIARELGPSIDPGAPSIYKVDYDPVDVPQVTSTDPAQAIQRGFETFVISPDYTYVNGTLLITDSSIGTYPRPDLSAVPTKLYAAGGSAGNSDFDNPSVFIVTASVSRAEAIAGAITEFRTPEPTLVGTKAPAGVTLNTSGIGNDRIGILAVDFLDGNNADRTNLAGRVRVAPDELYVVSFRFNSAGASNNHPYLRMRARSLKFQWAASLGIGGAKAVGSTQGQTLAAQALPGSGNQIPGAGLDGATYNLILPTPLDLSIRRDKLGTLAERFPTISAQPGPGVNSASVRDLKIGFDIVDSLSFASGQENEVANNTILNRVEVRKFTAPLD